MGLTAAAPQLGQNLNQEVIVNDVVTALQPSIAAAVANALRGLSSSSVTSFNSGSAGFSGSSSSTNSGFSSTGFSSNSGSSTGFSSNSGSSTGFSAGNSGSSTGFSSNSGFAAGSSFSGSAGAGGAALEVEDALTRPEYNFQFNVADDDSQTYITQQENRDGDAVTGTYSYVDPSGALVTVNYEAGPMGYSQTVEKQEGFVTISESNKAKINGAQAASNGGSAATGNAFSGGNSFRPSTQSGQVSTVTTSAIDQNALIAQIMAVLQPQISSAVNSAVLQQQSTTTTVGNSFRGNVAQAGNSFRGNTATRGQLSGSKSFQGSQTGTSFGSKSFGQSAQRGQQVSTVNYNGASSESALIAQILAVLQPQISLAVNTAVRQQQSTTSSRRVQSAQTGFRAASQQTGFSSANRQTGFRATSQRVSGDRLTPLFGN